MNRAKGPLWHKKQKDKGIVPDGLRGLDKDATWCTSHADGWIYGHGSFSLTNHRHPVLGCFMWMPNSGHEAKRMWFETAHLKSRVDYVSMDSKADSYPLYREFKRQRQMTLVTSSRRKKNKSGNRILMHKAMQGLVKDIFELDYCWMRGNAGNRWLFAAMGLTIQMHQLDAFNEKRSTWVIKTEVLG